MGASAKNSPVTEEHFRAFGAIIHLFARFEALLVGIMCVVTGAELTLLSMMTAELPYRGKRETLLAIIKVVDLAAEKVERITWFLGEIHKWNKLRNFIAHSTWKVGARPRSIKPFSLSVRGGSVTTHGMEHDERDYTDEELVDIANEMVKLHDQFQQYLLSADLLPKRSDNDRS